MRLAVVKPDWRISGGFEAVVGQVEGFLRAAGHDVERVVVDVPSLPRRPYGLSVDDVDWALAPEWFSHLAMTEAFAALDLSGYDAVLSTQPPSYAVRHPRQLALFYHHLRAYYDLAEVWTAAGLAPAHLHEPATRMLREVDAQGLAGVGHFLAGSPRVVDRLRDLSGIEDRVSTYLAPPQTPALDGPARAYDAGGHVLCVGRHEFTKRVELVVAAAALVPERGFVVTGTGGRLAHAQALSARLAEGRTDPASLTAEELWLNRGEVPSPPAVEPAGLPGLSFPGRVADERLAELYAGAACLVAPAYDEDYGLTVLEAMRAGVPVVVCRDGGGLRTFVEDDVTGVVADPTPAGLAAAVRGVLGGPDRARRLGEAGRDRAAEVTAASAAGTLLDALDRVMQVVA